MASPGQALTEEQRQQIISKLLAERRSKGGGPPNVSENESERAKRIQELLASRAAARRHPSNALALGREESCDALLSPASTCSLQSSRPAVRDPGGGIASPLQAGTSRTAAQSTAQQHIFARSHQPQQQTSQLQAAAQRRLSLDAGGPVDVSRLWETPNEQGSALALEEEYDASYCSTPHSAFSAEDQHLGQQLWHSQPTQSPEQALSPEQRTQQLCLQRQSWQAGPQHQHLQQPRQQQTAEQQQQIQQQRRTHQQHRAQTPLQQRQQHQQHQQQHSRQGQWQQKRQELQSGQQQRRQSPARQRASLPPGYPMSADERLLQLAQPKTTNTQKYEQMKQAADNEVLQHCSFTPRTGRGPRHRLGHEGLPVTERLYLKAAEQQAKFDRKAAEIQANSTAGCTFRPQTNKASHEKHLAAYEYVPIHMRLGEVLRSKNEKLAQIQLQVEQEHQDATFTPKINLRSSVLALRRSRHDASTEDRASPQRDQCRDSSRGLRRTRSEADLLAQQQECSFTPRINRSSKMILQASGEVPAGFLRRQEYFDRLAREKKQLLQLAVEDQHCSFNPGCSTSDLALGRSPSIIDDESYLERIERLAYQDSRQKQAARKALADQVYNQECTFRPAINPRSQRIAQATPLHELYENTKGKMKRGAAALAVQMQREQECTFSPNLQKQGVPQSAPADATLSLSSSEVDAVVRRLHSAQQNKEDKVEAAMSFKQYQELKQCTFAPDINKEVPRQEGPVLIRGLGRFMELKEMAKRQAEQKAAVEAKVFLTNIHASTRPQSFTVPRPFHLGRSAVSEQQEEQRRAQVEQQAQQYATRECTFKPQINSGRKTRQERVQRLLEMRASAR